MTFTAKALIFGMQDDAVWSNAVVHRLYTW